MPKQTSIVGIYPRIPFNPMSVLSPPPLGLPYVATILKEKGYDNIKLFDENRIRITDKKGNIVNQDILSANIVLISILSPNANNGIRYAKFIKQVNPETKVIIGGIHATVKPKEAFERSDADALVIGEGEKVITDILEKGLVGIVDGGVVKNLDSLPIPDLALIHGHEKKTIFDWIGAKDLLPISTVRGCPYDCDFCCASKAFGKAVRARSVESVLEEIERRAHWAKERGSKKIHFIFYDDTFSIVPRSKRIDQINGIIRIGEKYKIKIGADIQDRADLLLDEDYVKEISKVVGTVWLGIEGGYDEALRGRKKNLKVKQIEKAVTFLHKYGISVHGLCMLEPDRSPEDATRTIELINKLDIRTANFSILTPLPGTALEQEYKDRMIEGVTYDDMDCLHLTFHPKKMSFEQVAESTERMWKSFYTIPKMLRLLLKGDFLCLAISIYSRYLGGIIGKMQPKIRKERDK